MTDKQIIIDGVDVSGCKYWKGYCRIASLCDYAGHLCEVNPNCYYKQLKRKEQECEELKRQHQGDKGLITSTGKMNYQLIQEYDKLKTALTEIKFWARELIKRTGQVVPNEIKQILQKISECEG